MKTAPRSDTHARALQSLGAMTATVAHEMRNVLGGVELYATLVAEQCATDADLQPMTGRLLEGVTRLRAVAANLLSVSRRPEPREPMTRTSVAATPASLSASATTAAPEASPVSADFLALLLLTICVGMETSESESDTSDPADDQPVVQVGSVTINLADVTTIGTPTI